MRRLLLLLLTFLLPLQLLAATVGDLQARPGQDEGVATWPMLHQSGNAGAFDHVSASPALDAGAAAGKQVTVEIDARADGQLASTESGDGQNDDEADAGAAQVEFEDHTLPARLGTPDIPWHPFPHAFAAPLRWTSFVRDQLRPPPLA